MSEKIRNNKMYEGDDTELHINTPMERATGRLFFTKGEGDWYVLLPIRLSTTKLLYVSRFLVIVKLFTDLYSNATR